ncbi:hypothetical protein [Nocardia brevicatena]|uniref:hypothetical protein n=1 Tax=Nocardia brevicatena TaxID=37327 RepID=UPI0002DF7385|nr:hypothetical protein [Nocardia brevicatena]
MGRRDRLETAHPRTLRIIEAQNERIRQLDQQLAIMRQELEEASPALGTDRRGADDRDERRTPLEAAYGAVVELENLHHELPADLESEPDSGLPAAVQELQDGKNRGLALIDARATATGRMTTLGRISAALAAACLILALPAWLKSFKSWEPMRK